MEKVSFSFEAITELCALNKRLGQLTGIDFCRNLVTLACNEKKTEIDAQQFLKNNYPVKNISDENLQDINLLLDFYLYWVEYKDSEALPSYCICQPKENPDDRPFRSSSLRNFPINKKKLEFVTGFFPEN